MAMPVGGFLAIGVAVNTNGFARAETQLLRLGSAINKTRSDVGDLAAERVRESKQYKQVMEATEPDVEAQKQMRLAEANAKANAEREREIRLMTFSGMVYQSVGFALTGFSTVAAVAASNVMELTLALEVMADTAYRSEAAVFSAVDAIKDLDFTNRAALSSVNAIIGAKLDEEKAVRLAAVANDIAIARGRDAAQVYDMLVQSVTNASAASLRSLNISKSATEIFDQHAKTLGLVGDQLTHAEKQTAIYNEVLSAGSRFAGAYDAAQNTLTVSLRQLRASVDDLVVGLGQHLVPSIVSGTQAVTGLVDLLGRAPSSVSNFAASFISLSGAMFLTVGTANAMMVSTKLAMQVLTAATGIAAGKLVLVGVIAAATIAVLKAMVDATREAEHREMFGGVKQQLEEIRELNRISLQVETLRWTTMVSLARAAEVALSQFLDNVALKARGLQDALFGVNQTLFQLSQQSRELDRALYPLEDALTLAEARFTVINAHIQSQLRDVNKEYRQLSKESAAATATANRGLEEMQRLLFRIGQDMFKLRWALGDLDMALWPLQDSLRRVEAQVALIVIPLQRQLRVLERYRKDLEEVSKVEEKRRNDLIDMYKEQVDALRELLELDRKRLDFINQELFVENLRNTILRRETSARALSLRSQEMAQQDIIARRNEELQAAQDALKLQQEILKAIQEASRAQMDALDAQIRALNRVIELEEEKALWAREDLQMAEARQIEERLGLESQLRLLERQQTWESNILAIMQQQQTTSGRMHDARLTALEEERERLEDILEEERNKVGIRQAELAIAQVMQVLERLRIAVARREATEQQIELQNALTIQQHIQDVLGRQLEKVKEIREEYAKMLAEVEKNFPKVPIPTDVEEPEKRGYLETLRDMVLFGPSVQRGIAQEISGGWESLSRAWWKSILKALGLSKEDPVPSWIETNIIDGWWKVWNDVLLPTVTDPYGFMVMEGIIQPVEKLIQDWLDSIKRNGKGASDSTKEWTDEIDRTLTSWEGNSSTTVKIATANMEESVEGFTVSSLAEMARWRIGMLLQANNFQRQTNSVFSLWEQTAKASMRSIGMNLVEGLWEGVDNHWEYFAARFTGRLESIPDLAAEATQSASPAKSMIPIGRYLAQGIAVGFGSELPKLVSGFNQIVRGMEHSPVESSRRGPAGGTQVYNTYNIDRSNRFDVNANYGRVQNAGSVAADLRMLMELGRGG